MDTIVERPAALDVHKAQMTACVRVPNDRGEREERIAEFPTTVRGLLALRDWLAGYQVQQVVMEATGVHASEHSGVGRAHRPARCSF